MSAKKYALFELFFKGKRLIIRNKRGKVLYMRIRIEKENGLRITTVWPRKLPINASPNEYFQVIGLEVHDKIIIRVSDLYSLIELYFPYFFRLRKEFHYVVRYNNGLKLEEDSSSFEA